jgi:hypothetical protein
MLAGTVVDDAGGFNGQTLRMGGLRQLPPAPRRALTARSLRVTTPTASAQVVTGRCQKHA